MYLGSVKFFKHLIVGFILLIIIALLTAVIILASANGDKQREIEQLKADLYDKYGKITVADSEDEPVDTDDDNDDNNGVDINADISRDYPTWIGEQPPQADTPPPLPDIPHGEESAYSELFPDMYSEYARPEYYANDEGYIYLTFNGSPSAYTEDLLLYLDKQDVKATFFVNPKDTDNGRDLINRILDEGHEIGILGMSVDPEVIYASVEAFLEDFNSAFTLAYEQTGYKPYLFRFPHDSINDYNGEIRKDLIAEMTRRGFVYYDWNVNSRDALDHNYTQMWNSILSDVEKENRSVILFHDRPGGYNTILVIEEIIKQLVSRGYTLSEITPLTRPMQF